MPANGEPESDGSEAQPAAAEPAQQMVAGEDFIATYRMSSLETTFEGSQPSDTNDMVELSEHSTSDSPSD